MEYNTKDLLKMENGMYTMPEALDNIPSDIQNRYNDIIGSLSLFSALPDEDDPYQVKPPAMELERPVTPIELEIKSAPITLDKLQKYVRRRIQPNPSAKLSCDEQLELAGVIMAEIAGCWPDLRQQIDYPFFTEDENHELNRRIVVHIVTVCEELLKHYTAKSEILNKKQCFTVEANMTRLKSELALDASKYLSILTVRRYISEDMKARKAQGKQVYQSDPMFPDLDSVEPPQRDENPKERPSFKKMLDKSKPKDAYTGFRFKTIEQDLTELMKNMPDLDNEKLLDLLENMPDISSQEGITSRKKTVYDQIYESETDDTVKHPKMTFMTEQEEEDDLFFFLQRSESMPELKLHSTLIEDLDIDVTDWFPNKEVDEKNVTCPAQQKDIKNVTEEFHKLSQVTLKDDLSRLVSRGIRDQPNDPNADDDLPSLIQATQVVSKDPDHLEKLQDQIKYLDSKAAADELAEKFVPEPPKHVQPDTITRTAQGGAPVRTADVRPERRDCLGGVTLDLFSPVWNDLLDEIDQATVKQLDSNLFLGEEIREVYREIMKTVSRQHMDVTNDDLVQTCPESLDLTAVLASSSLHRRKNERIINPKIHRGQPPPWKDMTAKEWAKPKIFTPGDKKGTLNLEGVVDGIHRAKSAAAAEQNRRKNVFTGPLREQLPCPAARAPQPQYVLSVDEFKNNMGDAPKMVQDRLLRSYHNWLAWWRGTVNSDDYIKYVSTQETDYLGLVFHLYDSDDGDDDEVGGSPGLGGRTGSKLDLNSKTKPMSRAMERDRERENRLNELRAEKTAYCSGEWNVNTVIMGGLGRDPEIAEEDLPPLETLEEEADAGSVTTPAAKVGKLRSYIKKTGLGAAAGGAYSSGGLSSIAGSMARQLTVSSLASGGRSYSEISRPRSSHDSQVTSTRGGAGLSRLPRKISQQERLERLWSALRVPDGQRLDMAIKYAGGVSMATNKVTSEDPVASVSRSTKSSDKIEAALQQWETAAQVVLKREALIMNLEMFERRASDPNRFFAKGTRGSSKERLNEAKTRNDLYAEIEKVDDFVREAVLNLEVNFGDILTYQGRPYMDKMKWDRVEMLYWLQEERRRVAVLSVPESLSLQGPIRLPPIETTAAATAVQQ